MLLHYFNIIFFIRFEDDGDYGKYADSDDEYDNDDDSDYDDDDIGGSGDKNMEGDDSGDGVTDDDGEEEDEDQDDGDDDEDEGGEEENSEGLCMILFNPYNSRKYQYVYSQNSTSLIDVIFRKENKTFPHEMCILTGYKITC